MARTGSYDMLIKLLMLGDSGVGKTCLLNQYCDNTFSTSFITTIGIDFKIKTINIDNTRVRLQIWDTAGQERFRTITQAYYRGAEGILLVYDCTEEQSFLNVRNWMRDIKKHAADTVNIILISNKSDMVKRKFIVAARGQKLAEESGMEFFECSAKTNHNVKEAFLCIAKQVKKRKETHDPGLDTVVDIDSNNGSSCC